MDHWLGSWASWAKHYAFRLHDYSWLPIAGRLGERERDRVLGFVCRWFLFSFFATYFWIFSHHIQRETHTHTRACMHATSTICRQLPAWLGKRQSIFMRRVRESQLRFTVVAVVIIIVVVVSTRYKCCWLVCCLEAFVTSQVVRIFNTYLYLAHGYELWFICALVPSSNLLCCCSVTIFSETLTHNTHSARIS